MRERMPLAGVICAAALAALIIVSGLEVTRARADGAVISIDPPSQNVASDAQSFAVNVKIAGASNVAAFDVAVRYDAALVDVVDVTEGPFLASPDLHTQCERSTDTSHFGADVVQYGCLSTNQVFQYTGASGDGIAATITFHPKARGVVNLVFLKSLLSDPSENDVANSSTDGVVNIVDPGQTGGPLQPTPTANPGLKTPTSLPTPDTDPFVRPPGQGSTGNPTGGNPTGNAAAAATGGNSGAAAGASASGEGSLAGSSPSGVQLPPNSASSAGAASGDPNFPHAGTGPEQSGRDARWNYGIASLFCAGAVLLFAGRRKRIAQRARS